MPHLDPKFPVVKESPTVNDCIVACRYTDYMKLIGITCGSWTWGYWVGKPVRMPCANTTATIGFTFGTFLLLQDTTARFLGFKENAKEVANYGIAPEEFQPKKIVRDPRMPIKTPAYTTRPPINWKNYD